uniref:Secreted protein n=1 Tax=Globodera pallida TaxID=36090 RepID=A0A183BIE9_GLOPA
MNHYYHHNIAIFMLFCLVVQLQFSSINGLPILQRDRVKRGLGDYARIAASGAVSAVAWHATNKAINKIVG